MCLVLRRTFVVQPGEAFAIYQHWSSGFVCGPGVPPQSSKPGGYHGGI